jgi:hypothetical protein
LLERALEEASRLSLFEAKKLEKVDPPAAVLRMREFKGFQQELLVLKTTRSTGGEPADFRLIFLFVICTFSASFHSLLFYLLSISTFPPAYFPSPSFLPPPHFLSSFLRWETVSKEVVTEHKDIAEDHVELCILAASELSNLLAAHKSAALSVSFDLGMNEQGGGVGTTPSAKPAAGRVDFNHRVMVAGLKRGKTAQSTYSRKKASFELVAHKGMIFKSSEVIGVCVVCDGAVYLSPPLHRFVPKGCSQ